MTRGGKRPGSGRKAIPGTHRSVRLPDAAWAALERLADAQETTVHALCVRYIEVGIASDLADGEGEAGQG